jgi:exodeoxyribonuclease-3
VQETKASPNDVEQLWPATYTTFWNSAEKKGYSGTAIFTRARPLKVTPGIGQKVHDNEGRVLTAEYPEFFLVNVYVPNSQRELARLPYRQKWDRAFLKHLQKLEQAKPVVCCGDFNVAHREIDLANPKANEGNPGYLPEERAWMEKYLTSGYADAFRRLHAEQGQYTWWTYRVPGARERNVGWRIDYHCVDEGLMPAVLGTAIHPSILGSDHCPVSIDLDLQ